MDIFAHSVWAAIAAKKHNQVASETKSISVGWAAFWGVFPDLFAFGIPFFVLLFLLISGDIPFQPMWPGSAVVAERAPWIGQFIPFAYKISHSLVVFATVFVVAWLIKKKAPIAMLGWALHIFIDIFTHAATFFPTPFLWPISDWKFLYGFSWANGWFMIVNYATMLVLFCVMFLRRRE